MNFEDVTKSTDNGQTNTPRRRTLLTSAAWSVPVIAAAVAAPAAAASTCQPGTVTRRVEIPAESTTNATFGPRVVETVVVPDGVTLVTFTVLGGGGGQGSYNQVTDGPGGGDGDLVSGVLAVTPGATLTLIAGNGGMGPSALNQGTITGGAGYGNGGYTARPIASTGLTGGSGGGGSAILLDGEPAAVAGGGGGVGCVLARPSTGWTINGCSGGAAATNGQDVRIWRSQLSATEIAEGGGGAIGATPGQPRGTNGSNGTVDNGWRRIIGNPGTAPAGSGPDGGGNGGAGALSRAYNIGTQGTLQSGSAGGGGGYAGGASGTTLARVYDFTNPYQYALGSSGGGGSSFISDLVMGGAITSGDNGAPDGVRHPGYVEISYDVPC